MSGPVAPHPAAASALEQRFSLDVQGVDSLRRVARRSPDEGLRQVSRQFEALFMGMMLKSMRDATPASGLLEGQHTRMYMSMLDQQLAQHLSGRGMRLADSMYQQLRRSLGSDAGPADTASPAGAGPASAGPARPAAAASVAPGAPGAPGAGTGPDNGPARSTAVRTAYAAPVALAPLDLDAAGRAVGSSERARPASSLSARAQGFVDRLGEAARTAARATGIPETLILAQAALESAWGRREVRGDDGTPSFNVFGIKADRSWRGRVTEATTTEVIEGVAHKVRARFRAYGSYEEAFADYARFLTGNPRYGRVLGEGDPARAARELQRAGYATDPAYASKLVRVMKRLF